MKAEKSERRLPMDKVVNTLEAKGVSSDKLTQINNQSQTCNHTKLMDKVLERSNLKKALKRVVANKGAPGIDGMKVEELQDFLMDNWGTIKQELTKGVYKPSPVRRVEIPKPGGGMRQLGIPTVLDRFIQQAILQVLSPILEQTFSQYSYGFRPKKSARQAVKQARKYIEQGARYVVDMDIEKFFDKVNHDMLMNKIHKHIKDKQIIRIIRRYLQAGIMICGVCVTTEHGTPQGGPLSPLLSNIYLTDLDNELEKRGHKFVRYADDANIYVSSERAGKRVLNSMENFLGKKLKLRTNKEKSAVDKPSRSKFLGFSFFTRKGTPHIRIAPITIERFKNNIRRLTKRSTGESIEDKVNKLNKYITGWTAYFSIAKARSILRGLDSWIRRRLRMCLLKQWKRCKTKLRKLMKLGIPEDWAGRIAFSRKKCWRLSNTPQVAKALGTKFWQEQGLKSLVERYDEMCKRL